MIRASSASDNQQVDPLGKLPVYHFQPGGLALIVATGGCNLRCIYCLNWQQSQTAPDRLQNVLAAPVADVVKAAKGATAEKKDLAAIAFTYTDFVAFYEYARDIARKAKENNLRVVAGSAGYLNPKPLKEMTECVDAFTITLKGFSEVFYRNIVGGMLKPVLDTLVRIKESGRWLEVVNLVVPTLNDDPKDLRALCKWVKANLGADTPLHFERFTRAFKLKDLPDTPIQTCELARNIALEEGLKYVYLCNISPHDGNHTYCPKCGQTVVQRRGFTTVTVAIGKDGECSKCGTKLPGVWS